MIGQFQPSDQATYKCVVRNMYNDEVNATTNVGKESFIEDFLKVIINCPHAAIIVYVKGTASFLHTWQSFTQIYQNKEKYFRFKIR